MGKGKGPMETDGDEEYERLFPDEDEVIHVDYDDAANQSGSESDGEIRDPRNAEIEDKHFRRAIVESRRAFVDPDYEPYQGSSSSGPYYVDEPNVNPSLLDPEHLQPLQLVLANAKAEKAQKKRLAAIKQNEQTTESDKGKEKGKEKERQDAEQREHPEQRRAQDYQRQLETVYEQDVRNLKNMFAPNSRLGRALVTMTDRDFIKLLYRIWNHQTILARNNETIRKERDVVHDLTLTAWDFLNLQRKRMGQPILRLREELSALAGDLSTLQRNDQLGNDMAVRIRSWIPMITKWIDDDKAAGKVDKVDNAEAIVGDAEREEDRKLLRQMNNERKKEKNFVRDIIRAHRELEEDVPEEYERDTRRDLKRMLDLEADVIPETPTERRRREDADDAARLRKHAMTLLLWRGNGRNRLPNKRSERLMRWREWWNLGFLSDFFMLSLDHPLVEPLLTQTHDPGIEILQQLENALRREYLYEGRSSALPQTTDTTLNEFLEHGEDVAMQEAEDADEAEEAPASERSEDEEPPSGDEDASPQGSWPTLEEGGRRGGVKNGGSRAIAVSKPVTKRARAQSKRRSRRSVRQRKKSEKRRTAPRSRTKTRTPSKSTKQKSKRRVTKARRDSVSTKRNANHRPSILKAKR